MDSEPDLRTEGGERPQAPPESGTGIVLVLAGLLIVGVVAAWLWRSQRSATEEPAVAVAPEPVPQPAASAPPPAASVVKFPLPQVAEAPLASQDVPAALVDLLGAKAVTSFLQTDGFARRVVASIDSLGRAHSPLAAWPVFPTGGRFTVEERPGETVISPDNAARYTPFVLLVGTLDVPGAVRLYRRMYPLLQQAYRDLGFGDRYLNDRVIEVIDLLLATPEPETSPRLQLTEVKGPVPSTRPWVRYQFADPELESLAAGQKILVRMGIVNERRLKGKLEELRAQILSGSSPALGPVLPAPGGAASSPASAGAPVSAPSSAPAPKR